MKILVSCFKPFNNEKVNYSELVLDNYNNLNIKKIILDVVYEKDANVINDIISKDYYDYVLLTGEARNRKFVSLETTSRNLNDAKINDNRGTIKINQKIKENGNDYLTTNIDLSLLEGLSDNDTIISHDAGTFVCNDLYYRVLDYVYCNKINTKVLFIHFSDFVLPYFRL